MHDRAVRLTGAVRSAAAIAIEIMILLNIDLRITRVRPRVEKSVQRFQPRNAFEVATNMLVVIMESSEKWFIRREK
jgi:hypothetical protein